MVPSASLVSEDPTLLFVVAGMVPFLPYLLGQRRPPYNRAASAQKCLRTVDIERVGTNARTGTFFQMLGSWSFGDYFKDDAITWAWDLLTRPDHDGGFGFPENRLWATVYQDDDEAYGIWRDKVGLPESRIQRMGKADNYWDMGVPGPCGPDSEIWYDRGPDYGREGGPAVDEERYLEIWNLVFMQYQRGPGQGFDYEIIGDLPAKNIDTGMGLERMATILQGVDNIFEIDTTWKVLDRAAELTEQRYGQDRRSDVALRVVADHVDSAVMLVADGVLPANEGRGYVLRRLLRRSIRNLRLLAGGQRGSTEERFLHELTAAAIEAYGPQYPNLLRDAANIQTVIEAEEAAFLGTLRTGSAIFDAAVEEVKRRGSAELAGDQAFQLHDTYGFPIDLTLEMAAEQGLKVDEEGFRRLMTEQRERARKDAAEKKTGNADVSVFAALLERSGSVDFTGYDQVTGEAMVTGLLENGVQVAVGGNRHRDRHRARPDPVLRRGRRPAGRHRRDPGGRRRRHRRPRGGLRRADAAAGPDRAPQPGPGRGDRRGLARLRGDRHRTTAGGLPVAHRDPPAAPRLPRRARRLGRAGGLGELARAAAVRLHRDRRGAGLRAQGRRGRGQPGAGHRPGRPGLPHHDRGRAARWARSRCSARSTATTSGW